MLRYGTIISPSADQSVASTVWLTIFGVDSTAYGGAVSAFKCSLPT
jgi:hypothetical protein